jgi:hypothetical protein
VLKYEELRADADGVARQLVNQSTRWQVPDLPDGKSVLISDETPAQSALLMRMR